jgi:hypothetical protein
LINKFLFYFIITEGKVAQEARNQSNETAQATRITGITLEVSDRIFIH